MLSPRTATILKSIVGQYITTAVPVPSQAIAHNFELGVSTATIRNEMAYLEQEGYITRPHPSAGSVPSDKGYRYYVESLSAIELPLAKQRLVNHLFHQVEYKLEEWLTLATTLTAQLTQNVALATMPRTANCQLKRVELIALQDSIALVILVLHGAKVKQQLVTFDQVISQPGLTATTNKLNAAYADLTRPQISDKDIELSPAEKQVTDCLLKMMQAEDEQEYKEPYLDGLHFMLNQPEFTQSRQMLALVELIEHRNLLKTIVPRELSQGVHVIIGKENRTEAVQNYSVVISRYGLPQEAIGTIGVIGPTRMPYAHTISTVSYLSLVLSKLVTELYGKETYNRSISYDND